MTWSDLPKNPSHRILREFSAVWLVLFLTLAASQYSRHAHHQLGGTLGVAGIVIGGLGLIKPAAVRWLFIGCMILAFPIGWLVSQLMLALMFFGIIAPIALVFRVVGRDVLLKKPAHHRSSFWMPKKIPEDVRSYLRQY